MEMMLSKLKRYMAELINKMPHVMSKSGKHEEATVRWGETECEDKTRSDRKVEGRENEKEMQIMLCQNL